MFEGPVNRAFGFGITKQMTHAICLQLAERKELKGGDVCCILPTVLDTEANRKERVEITMGRRLREEEKKKQVLVPTDKVAELLRQWADGENRPENGSFAKLNYKNGTVVPEFL